MVVVVVGFGVVVVGLVVVVVGFGVVVVGLVVGVGLGVVVDSVVCRVVPCYDENDRETDRHIDR